MPEFNWEEHEYEDESYEDFVDDDFLDNFWGSDHDEYWVEDTLAEIWEESDEPDFLTGDDSDWDHEYDDTRGLGSDDSEF